MRTKNLNLKKKIAFIASVAMIASTAAYLPNGVVNLNADAQGAYWTVEDTSTSPATYKSHGVYVSDDAAQVGTATAIDTVDIFVKINGKYLSVKRTTVDTATPEFKLTDTADLSANGDWQPVLANEALAAVSGLLAQGTDPFEAKKSDNTAYSTPDAKYDVIKLDDTKVKQNALELPYFADASEVELEVAAKGKAVLGKNSVESIVISLNDHGMGKVAKQNEYIIGKTDASNFDEDKKQFKDTAAGAYEIIDLSGLVVSMTNIGNANEATAMSANGSAVGAKITEIKDNGVTYTGTADASDGSTKKLIGATDYVTGNTAGTTGLFGFAPSYQTIDEDENITPVTYGVEKIGNVYAKVIKTTLNKAVEPGAIIKIDTGVNGNWKASGSNVNSNTGVLTLSMDIDTKNEKNNGYAQSGLVTMTQGSKKEYYKFVVANPADALGSDFGNTTSAQKVGFNVDSLKGETASASTAGTADGTLLTGLTYDGDYKIEKVVSSEKLKYDGTATKDQFITKYIVYNNARDEKFTAGTNKVTITLTDTAANGHFALASNRTASSGTVANMTTWTSETSENKTVISADTAGATASDPNTQTVTLELSTAGSGTTAPIDWYNGSNVYQGTFVIEFTNQYELKYDNQWEDNREDNTKNYDGTVSVTDGTKFSNPGNVDRPGFEFVGWRTNNETTGNNDPKPVTAGSGPSATVANEYAYNVNAGSDQVLGTVITPNTKLFATYTGLRYNVDLDANGGYFAASANGGTLTKYEYYPGINTKTATGINYAQQQRKANANADITIWKAETPAKTGYVFKGWNTDKDATEAMTTKQLAAAFPGEGKTLTLYAVYEANEVTANFNYLPFNTNGSVETMDGKFQGNNGVGKAWIDAAANTAKFEKAADGYVTFKTGEKLGDLPTPYLAGYEFEGWYAAVFSDNLTEVSAVKVTADTVLDETMFADPANFGTKNTSPTISYNVDPNAGTSTNGSDVYLYAKFVPKTYTITFDIGDGLWATTKFNDGEEGKIPATVQKNSNTGAYIYKRADGSMLGTGDDWADEALTAADNPKCGDGKFVAFKNWTINDGKKTYSDLTAVKKAIEAMDKLEDIVVKANFEDKSNSQASIFLNANEGAVYKYRTDEKDPSTKKPTSFLTGTDLEHYSFAADATNNGTGTPFTDSNGGSYLIYLTAANQKFDVHTPAVSGGAAEASVGKNKAEEVFAEYVTEEAADDVVGDFEAPGYAFNQSAAGTKVKDNYKISGAYIEEEGTNNGYVFARPGYTFKGWYLDKECTKPYTFDVYPDKGTQTIVFAKWEANTTVRYNLAYDLFNGDKSEATDKEIYLVGKNNNRRDSNMKYVRTFMGTAGEKVNAKDLTITVKDGTGKDATETKYIFDAALSKNLDTTEKELKCEFSVAHLRAGKFEQAEPYTLIEGRFMEEGYQTEDPDPENPNPQEEDLGAATDVKVAGGVVTWKAAKGAASYRYKVIDKNGNVKYAAATVKGTSQTLAVADIPADDYKIAVIAIAKDGKTTKTTEPIEVKVAKTNLTAPTDVKWADGVLTWTAATDAHHYNVKKVYTNGNVKYVGGTADATLDLAAESVDFTAYVIAVDANGKTATSTKGAKVAADTKKVLGVVTDAKYDAKDNTVSWTAVANAKSYNICKMVNGKKFWVTGVKDTSYKFENKTPAFNYYVVAVAEDGDYTIGTFNAYPTMATDVVVTEGSKKVTWTAAEGAKYYKIGKVSADGKKVVWNNNKIEGTEGTFSYACTAGQKVVVMAVFKDEAKNLQTTRSATVVAAAAKADK